MPDITMCEDHVCPKRENCFRYTAIPDPYRQSYFVGSPRQPNGCLNFWPLEETDESRSRHRNKLQSRQDLDSSN